MSNGNRVHCRDIEARLEDYLDGDTELANAEITAHLESCPACRDALAAARLGRSLLREGREPAREPSPAFGARVVACIRAREAEEQQFWRPLEVLASRLVFAATAAVLVLALYLFEFAPPRNSGQVPVQGEVAEGFPELGGRPTVQEEIF